MTDDVLNLDWETFSELPIKAGTYQYMKHTSTELLMAAYSMNGGRVEQEDLTDQPCISQYLRGALTDPEVIIRAYNAPFERRAIVDILKIPLPPQRFRCTMVESWALSFAGSMGEVGAQIGIDPELLKMDRGSYLINKFCKPAPKKHKVSRYTRLTSPDDWQLFLDYNRQDVVAEMAIAEAIEPYAFNRVQWEEWFVDQLINDRGLPIDMGSVDGALLIAADEKLRLLTALKELTGLSNPNSVQQLQSWLGASGIRMPNMQAATLVRILKNKIPPNIRKVLELKQMLSKTSIAKYVVLEASSVNDGLGNHRLKGTLQFGGAQRTKRWAGRMFQPHNIARPGIANPEELASILAVGDRDLIELMHGPVMAFLSDCTRSMIKAPDSKRIAVCDLKSIESRLLAWNSGCERLNTLYLEGLDGYLDFGSEFFRVPYAEVTSKQRKYVKPPTLGCGFGLGAVGLVAYAEGMGVVMDSKDAERAVKVYRTMYPEVPAMWYGLLDACIDCIENYSTFEGFGVSIHRDDHFMFIKLPSGRSIAYYQPAILMLKPPWKGDPAPRPTVTYMGRHDKTRKWVRQSTHGGKITENICQAEARDVLMFGINNLEDDRDFDVVGHVHDEIITIIDAENADAKVLRMEHYMSLVPQCMPGLVLGGEGFHASRYTKR